jgi:site-specific recombinase XerD
MQPKTREANWFQHNTRVLQAYLGHRNIQNTVRYTELSPDRFKDLR